MTDHRSNMSLTILNSMPCKVTPAQIINALQIEETSVTVAELIKLIQNARACDGPNAIFGEAPIRAKGPNFVSIGDLTFKSRILSANLEPVDRVYPFIVTCGQDMDEWLHRLAEDALQSYWADQIVEKILDSALDMLKEQLQTKFNLGSIAMMNPGTLEDWPLEEQAKLFALLGDTTALIGVTLTESYLMTPVKSLSGLFFKNDTNYVNCRLCPKEHCRKRRVSYDKRQSSMTKDSHL